MGEGLQDLIGALEGIEAELERANDLREYEILARSELRRGDLIGLYDERRTRSMQLGAKLWLNRDT